MPVCSVPLCVNDENSGKSFFKLPGEKELREKWIYFLRKSGKTFVKNPECLRDFNHLRVCEDHFDPAYIFTSPDTSTKKMWNQAIPMFFQSRDVIPGSRCQSCFIPTRFNNQKVCPRLRRIFSIIVPDLTLDEGPICRTCALSLNKIDGYRNKVLNSHRTYKNNEAPDPVPGMNVEDEPPTSTVIDTFIKEEPLDLGIDIKEEPKDQEETSCVNSIPWTSMFEDIVPDVPIKTEPVEPPVVPVKFFPRVNISNLPVEPPIVPVGNLKRFNISNPPIEPPVVPFKNIPRVHNIPPVIPVKNVPRVNISHLPVIKLPPCVTLTTIKNRSNALAKSISSPWSSKVLQTKSSTQQLKPEVVKKPIAMVKIQAVQSVEKPIPTATISKPPEAAIKKEIIPAKVEKPAKKKLQPATVEKPAEIVIPTQNDDFQEMMILEEVDTKELEHLKSASGNSKKTISTKSETQSYIKKEKPSTDDEKEKNSPPRKLVCQLCNFTTENKEIHQRHVDFFHQGTLFYPETYDWSSLKVNSYSKRTFLKNMRRVKDQENPDEAELEASEEKSEEKQPKEEKMSNEDSENSRRKSKLVPRKLDDIKERKEPKNIKNMFFRDGVKYFKCNVCPREFNNYSSLWSHRMGTHSKEYFICDLCGARITFMRKCLRRHMARRHLNKTKQCHRCHKKFALEYSLKRHMANVHRPGEVDDGLRADTVTNLFNCSVCSEAFVLRRICKKHMIQEHNFKFPKKKKKRVKKQEPIESLLQRIRQTPNIR